MMISPSTFMFMLSLILGIGLSVSSDSWFGAWCGLELNLMSFIPLIYIKANRYSSEAALKYFLIQALGSAFIILGAVVGVVAVEFVSLMSLALLLKLGAAPFHFWFPQVMEGLMWPQAFMLMTVQKLAPMYLLTYTLSGVNSMILMFSAMISAMVGAVGGINQTLLRKILAFSSINHMSWMLMGVVISETIWFLYFGFYVVVSLTVVCIFHYQQFFHIHQLVFFNKPVVGLVSFMSMLSMGGLPPFTGFLPKWVIMQEMVEVKLWFPFLVLLLSALLTLYYYLRVGIVFFNFVVVGFKFSVGFSHKSDILPLVLMLNFFGLLFPSVFIAMC